MPAFSVLILFATACLALAAIPGPDMLLIASRSLSQGRKAGFATLAGIQLGTYCHALALALGLTNFFLLVPLAYDLLRWVGAAYLMFLAYRAFRGSGGLTPLSSGEGEEDKNNRKSKRDIFPVYSVARIFRQGLWTNLLNPKMALFVLALFPQFVDPKAGTIFLQILILATILNGIGLLVNGLVILMTSRFSNHLTANPRFQVFSRYLMGTVFAGLACRLVLSPRN